MGRCRSRGRGGGLNHARSEGLRLRRDRTRRSGARRLSWDHGRRRARGLRRRGRRRGLSALRHQVGHRRHAVDGRTFDHRRRSTRARVIRDATADALLANGRWVLPRLLLGQGDVQLAAGRLGQAVEAIERSILGAGPIRRFTRSCTWVHLAVPVKVGICAIVRLEVNARAAAPLFTPTLDSLVLGIGLLVTHAMNLRLWSDSDNHIAHRMRHHVRSRLTATGVHAI